MRCNTGIGLLRDSTTVLLALRIRRRDSAELTECAYRRRREPVGAGRSRGRAGEAGRGGKASRVGEGEAVVISAGCEIYAVFLPSSVSPRETTHKSLNLLARPTGIEPVFPP
jgi:hypothetical protein